MLTLITRDESRHMGFGILYVAEWMRTHALDERIDFARRWLGQILFAATDQPGPLMLARLLRRLQRSRRRRRRAPRPRSCCASSSEINAARAPPRCSPAAACRSS